METAIFSFIFLFPSFLPPFIFPSIKPSLFLNFCLLCLFPFKKKTAYHTFTYNFPPLYLSFPPSLHSPLVTSFSYYILSYFPPFVISLNITPWRFKETPNKHFYMFSLSPSFNSSIYSLICQDFIFFFLSLHFSTPSSPS